MSTKNLFRRQRIPDVLLTNDKLIFVESIVTLLIIWAVASRVLGLADTISSPILVGASLFELGASMEWVGHLRATIVRVFYAFALTLVVGTGLGIVMGVSDFWKRALQDYVVVGLAFPSLFAAVFAAIWFGFSPLTPMVAGALISFPFLTQNVYKGIDNIDQRLIEMSSAFDVPRRQVIRRVLVMSTLPEWFSGVRYSLALSWKVITLAELVAADSGIGYMIGVQMNVLSLTGVIAWTAVFTIVMLIVEYGVLRQLEKRLFAWRQDVSIGWS